MKRYTPQLPAVGLLWWHSLVASLKARIALQKRWQVRGQGPAEAKTRSAEGSAGGAAASGNGAQAAVSSCRPNSAGQFLGGHLTAQELPEDTTSHSFQL